MSPSANIVPSGGECKVFKAKVSSSNTNVSGPDVKQGEKSKRWENVRKIVQERRKKREESNFQSNIVETDPTSSNTATVYFPGNSSGSENSPPVESEVEEKEEVIFRSTDIRYRNKTAKQKTNTESLKKKSEVTKVDINVDACLQAKAVSDKTEVPVLVPTVLPKIPALSSTSGYYTWMIPAVVCTPQRLFQKSADVDILIQRIRKFLWVDPTIPPGIITPSTAHFYNMEGDEFEEAIEKLLLEDTIGVSYEGFKDSEMKYLVISTKSDVHIFDVEAFGMNLFRWGLYSVLGNGDCVKVVHDCRQLCDILFKQFDLSLENVFDTMAAHLVVANWMLERKLTKRQTIRNVCQNYLGVVLNHLPDENPLCQETLEDMLMGSVRNCMYQLPLYEVLVSGMELPVSLVTRAVMARMEAADDDTAHRWRLAPQKAMKEVFNCLPLWLK